jgi:small subunit ribosomal protein S20
MPNKKSAMKALRQAEKRNVQNRTTKDAIKKLRKEGRKAIEANKLDEARALAPKLAKTVDKAAKNNVLKANTAARIKSRYAKALSAAAKKEKKEQKK